MAPFNVTVDDSSPLISYSPASAWDDSKGSTDPSGYTANSYHFTATQGAAATITFDGTGIWLYGAKMPNYGAYTIQVDGQAISSGNASSRTTEVGRLLGGVNGLPMGIHKAVLTSTDGVGLDFDSFVFETQAGTTSGAVSKATVDDADPRIQYGGLATTVWQTNNNPNFRNGTLHFSESGSAQATWEFDGDAVAVYGTASPNHGDLQVLVDGTVQQTVTPYAGVNTVHDQTLLYFGTNFSAGKHALTLIGNPGQTDAMTGKFVDIDFVQIYSSATRYDSHLEAVHTPATAKLPLAAIIGGAIGGVVLLLALISLLLCVVRRQRHSATARGMMRPSPSTPALPFQFSNSPSDTEKALGFGLGAPAPPVLIPTFAFAPGTLAAPMLRTISAESTDSAGSDDTSSLVTYPHPHKVPRVPPPSVAPTMPSRSDASAMNQTSSLHTVSSNFSMRSDSPPRSATTDEPSIKRPTRPPSLLLSAVNLPTSARPTRPERPSNPHLSVLNDQRGSAQAVSEAEYPMPPLPYAPVGALAPKRRQTRRATGRDSMQTIGIVGYYTDN